MILNDAELRQLTGKPNLISAAKDVLRRGPPGPARPEVIIAKQGEYGAALVTARELLPLPAFPLETVVDPTGAGDTFAGGFVGYIAAHAGEVRPTRRLRHAMAYGTALASFNVEEFGTERVARLTGGEVAERVAELSRITHFEDAPVELRG